MPARVLLPFVLGRVAQPGGFAGRIAETVLGNALSRLLGIRLQGRSVACACGRAVVCCPWQLPFLATLRHGNSPQIPNRMSRLLPNPSIAGPPLLATLQACHALLAVVAELKRNALLNDVQGRNAEVRLLLCCLGGGVAAG